MNQETVHEYIAGYYQLKNRIHEVACIVAAIRKTLYKHTPEHCYVDFEIEGLIITAHFAESTCGCCGSEDYYISFPISYLWTDNVQAVESADWEAFQAEEKRKADAQAKTDAEDRARLSARRERELYNQLKAKYETGTSD